MIKRILVLFLGLVTFGVKAEPWSATITYATNTGHINRPAGFWTNQPSDTQFSNAVMEVVDGTLTATNGVILPAVTGPPAIAQPGAYLRSDGTNLLVVFQDSGGNKTTNKVSLSAYP